MHYLERRGYKALSQLDSSSPLKQRGTCFNANLVLLLINTSLLLLSSVLFWNSRSAPSSQSTKDERYSNHKLNPYLKTTSSYSPILDLVDLQPSLKTLNGALHDNTSIWRLPPSPEVDEAWDYLSAEDLQLITVSAADITKSGKNHSISVKAPASWHRGNDDDDDEAYIAQIEVFHQIHCLNELRKQAFPSYYAGKVEADDASMLRSDHVGHCVHMLLQTLVCNADVGIISHYWVRNEHYKGQEKTRPFPDFGVQKQCRDFGALMDWLRTSEDGGVPDLLGKLPLKYTGDAPIMEGDGYVSH